MSRLDYKGDNDLPEGVMRISPSRFSMFMDRPHQWYREVMLGEGGFEGNTSSVIGTCVHWCAEQVALGAEVSSEEIEEYIDSFADNEEVDTELVKRSYKDMATRLVNDWVLPHMPLRPEVDLSYKIDDDIILSGSIDAVRNGQVVDYKTYSSKTKPRAIPMGYRYQLLLYAYLCRKNNISIDRITLVYVNRNIDGGISEKTGKPLKSYPPEVTELTEQITEEDYEFIESVLMLLVDTIKLVKERPEYAYLLFRDYRLKGE